MTDERLRKSARDAASGGPEAEAQLLKECVRAGTLTQEHLELAAYCDHEPARLLLDAPPKVSKKTHRWFFGLARYGLQAYLHGVVVCVELWLPFSDPEDQPAGQALLAATKAYADCPCLDHATVGQNAVRRLGYAGNGVAPAFAHPWEPGLEGVTLLEAPQSDATRAFVNDLKKVGALARHTGSAVVLESFGPTKVLVIRAVREHLGTSLEESKALADQSSYVADPLWLVANTGAARKTMAAAVLAWALA